MNIGYLILIDQIFEIGAHAIFRKIAEFFFNLVKGIIIDKK